MKDLLGMSDDEMHEGFAEWNKGDLDSYLIEIPATFLPLRIPMANHWLKKSLIPQDRRVPVNGPELLPLI
jgi:6-phosphogluconate dehydrogenase